MANSKGGRPGLNVRRKNALARLEQQYEAFKSAHTDKEGHWGTRNGKPHYHKPRTYEAECERFIRDIECLKAKIKI